MLAVEHGALPRQQRACRSCAWVLDRLLALDSGSSQASPPNNEQQLCLFKLQIRQATSAYVGLATWMREMYTLQAPLLLVSYS